MKEYINREHALKCCEHESVCVMANDSEINEIMNDYNPSSFIAGYEAALTRISNNLTSISAADVEPVVHARWNMIEKEGFWIGQMEESFKTGKPTKCSLPVCSHCKTEFGTVVLGYKRCPECGAIMDEVKE